MTEKKIKSYPVPWEGRLMLACRKCQKKLKKEDGFEALANVRKTVKRRGKRLDQNFFHVINVPCMDLCPKHAVTIYTPGHSGDRLLILRTEEDLDSL
jgi:hypothetical protein